MEKLLDPSNAKGNYQSHIRRKNRKLVRQSKIITNQPKSFERLNPVDIKSNITEQPKTSHKLSKTIRESEKIVKTKKM